MTCGAIHASTCGALALACNLDAGHELPHGVRVQPALPPYVVWPVSFTDADEAERADRLPWRKRHVRRAYQTLAMWRAGR